MSKIRPFKGKLEDKKVQNSITTKGLTLAVSGLLMATGFLLSENPQEVHAEAVVIDKVPTTSRGSGTIKAETQKDSVEIVKEQQVNFDLIESNIMNVLQSIKLKHNSKLYTSQYRKTLNFPLNKDNGLDQKSIETIIKLLKYHGSNEFDITVTQNANTPKDNVTVIVGFAPDLSGKDVNGYAPKLNLNEYTQEDLTKLVSRYSNVLGLMGYDMIDYNSNHTKIKDIEFRMNYDNGRIQYEYNQIMDLIDKYIKENNLKDTKDKKFSLKITDSNKAKHIKVSIFSNLPKTTVNKQTEGSSILKAELEVKEPSVEVTVPSTEEIVKDSLSDDADVSTSSTGDIVTPQTPKTDDSKEKEEVETEVTKPLDFSRTTIGDTLVIVPEELTPQQKEAKAFVEGVNNKILEFVNKERTKEGKGAFQVSEESARYALEKATDMLNEGSLTTENQAENTVLNYMLRDNINVTKVDEHGTKVQKVGVNETAQAIIKRLKEDTTYNRNILSDEFKLTGVGICFSDKGDVYATQIFIK